MARRAFVPPLLATGAFTLDEARTAGLTSSALRSAIWRRLGKGMYARSNTQIDPWQLLRAWLRMLGNEVTFSGRTAAWIHGLDFDPANPVQIIAPLASHSRSFDGVEVRHCDLAAGEITLRRDLHATSLNRTLRDFCLQESAVEALVAIDMALAQRITDLVSLARYVQETAGFPGSARMRRLVPL